MMCIRRKLKRKVGMLKVGQYCAKFVKLLEIFIFVFDKILIDRNISSEYKHSPEADKAAVPRINKSGSCRASEC